MGDRETGHWPLLFMMSSRSSSSRSTFWERPICPSLGALCPSLCGLLPPSCPLTWGCPGLYCPAGPGCRGGPLGGMSSGIPDAPYMSCLLLDHHQMSALHQFFPPSLPQFLFTNKWTLGPSKTAFTPQIQP